MRFPFSRPRWAAVALAVCVGALPLAGCNVFESFSSEPAATDALVQDAIVARQQGDVARARTLLTTAFETDPDSAPVRVELARTLLLDQGLDVFTIRSVADYLRTAANAPRPASPTPGSPFCSVPGADQGTPLDASSVEGYDEIATAQAAVGEALALLLGGGAPVVTLPAATSALCAAVDASTGVADADVAAVDARLRSRGLTRAQMDAAYADAALALLAQTYLSLFVDQDVEGVTFYGGGGTLGFCVSAPLPDVLAAFRSQTAALTNAVYALSVRAQLSGSRNAQTLAAEGAGVLRAVSAFAPLCTGGRP